MNLELRKKLSRTYELGGPKIYSFYKLISLMLDNLNRRRFLIKLNPRLMIFPGYILIQMELTKKSKYVVENTSGVMSFVGPKGGSPIPLRVSEVKRIFGEVKYWSYQRFA